MGMSITADRIAMLQKQDQMGTHIVINDFCLRMGLQGAQKLSLKYLLIMIKVILIDDEMHCLKT